MPTATPTSPTMTPPAGPARPPAPSSAPVTPLSMNPIDPMRILRGYYPWFIGSAIVGVVLGVGIYVGLLKLMPRYSAILQLDVMPLEANITDVGQLATGVGGRDEMEAYMATQALILGSDRIYSEALEKSDVQSTKWGQQFQMSGGFNAVEALEALRGIASSRAVPDTTFIQLRVTTADKYDAATIANTIGSVYLKENSSATTRPQGETLEDLEATKRDIEADLAALDASMETLLNDRDITGLEQQQQVYYVEVQNLQPALVSTRELLAQTRERLVQYEDLMNSDVGGEGIIFPEQIRQEAESLPIVQQLKANITNTKTALRSASEHYGRNHMTVQRLERTLRSYEQELANTTQQEMAKLFGATLESLRNTVRGYEASEAQFIERLSAAQLRLNEITLILKKHDDLQAKRSTKLDQLAEVETDIDQIKRRQARGGRVRRHSPAVPPDRVSFPLLLPTVAVVTFLSVSFVGGIVVLRELREQRIRGPQDVSRIPRTPFLGFVPDASMDLARPESVEKACFECPQGAIAESYRQIRVNILKACDRHGHKAILFAAGMPGSGNTAVATSFAGMAAAVDRKVLLVDANLRRPSIHGIFELQQEPGLGELLKGEAGFEDVIHPSGLNPNLYVMPSGIPEPGAFERFTTQHMTDIIKRARKEFDLVVFDVAPTIVSGDALALASQCDATVLVVRAYGEKRGLVARLRNQFNDIDAEFLGVIVNAVRHTAGGYFKSNVRATAEYVQSPALDGENSPASASDNGQAADTGSEPPKQTEKE